MSGSYVWNGPGVFRHRYKEYPSGSVMPDGIDPDRMAWFVKCGAVTEVQDAAGTEVQDAAGTEAQETKDPEVKKTVKKVAK